MAKFLGWDLEFKDETNNKTYTSEIVDLAIGEDVASSIVMCSIKFSIDTSFLSYFLKPHEGTLTIINKQVYTDEENEMFMIKLQSVSNVGTVLERDPEQKQGNITLIPVRYMCKNGVQLLNAKVGDLYLQKTLGEVVKAIYDKAKEESQCNIELKMDEPDDKSTYDYGISIHSGATSIEAIRYINQQYGLYNSMFLMFGDTFYSSESSPTWTITSLNKIKREEVKLYMMQYDQNTKKDIKSIEERTYYTYIPINILNNFTQIEMKTPQLIKGVFTDNDKFMKRIDIPVAKTLKEMNFLSSNEQFDKLMNMGTKMFSGTRFNQKDHAAKDIIDKVGLSAYRVPNISIPHPFKLSHFQIGTPINFISQSNGFIDSDVKLVILGWYLRIKQGNSELKVRTCATSFLGSNNS